MSTMGGGGVWFLEAQEVNPEARTTAARRVRVTFISMDLFFVRFVTVRHCCRSGPFGTVPTAAHP